MAKIKTVKPKAKVYIDAANVFFTQKKLGWMIDWFKFKNMIESDFDILEYRYYVALKKNDDRDSSFLKMLSHLQFKLITKPLKKIREHFIDEDGHIAENIKLKGNFDVEITRDILLDNDMYENLILLSGDSDFAVLKKNWVEKGHKLLLITSRKTMAWELKMVAEKVLFLEDVKQAIIRGEWLTKTKKNGINLVIKQNR